MHSEGFETVFQIIEEYICWIYNLKTINVINLGRVEVFDKYYKLQSPNEKFIEKSFVNFEASKWPPCKSELKMQLLRVIYISTKYRCVFMKNSPFMDPLMFGWISAEDKFEFSWFEGDQSSGNARNFNRGHCKF